MKVEVLPKYDQVIDLAEFEEKHSLEMVVKQRSPVDAAKYGKWYAQLQNPASGYGISIANGPDDKFLQGFTGDGETPDEAATSYLKRVSNKFIVPDMTDRTKDFWAGDIQYKPAN